MHNPGRNEPDVSAPPEGPLPLAEDWAALGADGAVPVVLVRHGRTAWNRERRFLGRTDIPLDEHGRAEALAVARHLAGVPLAAVHSSPLSRAAQTAEIIAREHDLSPLHEPDLVELSQGILEGRPGSVLPEQYPEFLAQWIEDPTDARVPEGESMGECQARSLQGLRRVLSTAEPGRPVAVVSHQMVIASVLCHALGRHLREWRDLGHRNAAYTVLLARQGELHVHRLHAVEHLPPAD